MNRRGRDGGGGGGGGREGLGGGGGGDLRESSAPLPVPERLAASEQVRDCHACRKAHR